MDMFDPKPALEKYAGQRPAEVDPAGYETPGLAEHEDRWLWIGRTPWDRLLMIVYTDEDLPLLRIITAFDAEGRWVDEYYGR